MALMNYELFLSEPSLTGTIIGGTNTMLKRRLVNTTLLISLMGWSLIITGCGYIHLGSHLNAEPQEKAGSAELSSAYEQQGSSSFGGEDIIPSDAYLLLDDDLARSSGGAPCFDCTYPSYYREYREPDRYGGYDAYWGNRYYYGYGSSIPRIEPVIIYRTNQLISDHSHSRYHGRRHHHHPYRSPIPGIFHHWNYYVPAPPKGLQPLPGGFRSKTYYRNEHSRLNSPYYSPGVRKYHHPDRPRRPGRPGYPPRKPVKPHSFHR